MYRGCQAFSGMTNNNGFAQVSNPYQPFIHTWVMLTQDIVVIHSTENCHLWSDSCPKCVEWTLLNRKDGGCDETPTTSILCVSQMSVVVV